MSIFLDMREQRRNKGAYLLALFIYVKQSLCKDFCNKGKYIIHHFFANLASLKEMKKKIYREKEKKLGTTRFIQ
jgi:hypothetical protein